MTNAFNGIISRYGEVTKISWQGTEIMTKSFLQPVINSSSGDKKTITPLGEVNTTNYYWFAPADIKLDTDKQITIEACGKTYELIKAEMFIAMGRVSHWEGVLRVRDEYDGA